MTDPPGMAENLVRTGHFIFHVQRVKSGTWNWRLCVEVIRTGHSGVFDSMLDAVRFMREHMAVDEDAEAAAPPDMEATYHARLDGSGAAKWSPEAP